jgi:hypothetical protein
MSTMHDYTFQILAHQRHDEFVAQATNDRLVRIATSGRPTWWQRIIGGSDRSAAVRPSHTSRPAQVH